MLILILLKKNEVSLNKIMQTLTATSQSLDFTANALENTLLT